MNTTQPDRPDDADATRVNPNSPPGVAYPGGPVVPPRFGDFEIVSRIGSGAFGQVFLARQVSLGRAVALKVVVREASDQKEGRLLAGLEHDHIVKVYSAFDDPATGLNGLCLQYVPGADLGVLIRHLYADGNRPGSGRDLLAALDQLRRGDPGFDPGAIRDREALAADDFPQALCRLGAKLAEALAFAHARGILHCDIKPGNILLTPYGRPLLADFNVAFDRTRARTGRAQYGGTLAYMAPEYYAAVLGRPDGRVDERGDVYALGVVLHELATGARPVAVWYEADSEGNETLMPGSTEVRTIAAARATAKDLLGGVPREVAAVIRRAIHPDPAARYQTASELAAALTGAGELLAARRALPPPTPVGAWVSRRPVLALLLAGAAPHLVASVVQIGYNAVEIQLDPPQTVAFGWLVLAYNLIAYPVCGGLGLWYFWRVAGRLPTVPTLSGPALDAFRTDVLRLGRRSAVLGAAGWFPGALVFPLVIDLWAGPTGWRVYAHFAISFTLAGLIGVVFSYLTIAYVALRALVPHLGNPDAPGELAVGIGLLTAPFAALNGLACGVPLVGAVLLLFLADEKLTLGFRILLVGLIGLGVAGVGIAERIVRGARQLAAVWPAPR